MHDWRKSICKQKQTKIVQIMAENDSEWNASCALQKTFLGARQTFPKRKLFWASSSFRRHSHMSQQTFSPAPNPNVEKIRHKAPISIAITKKLTIDGIIDASGPKQCW